MSALAARPNEDPPAGGRGVPGAGRRPWAAPLARWRAQQRRFDQRVQRERLLLIGAAVALALMAADQLWLGPAFKAFQAARAAQAQAGSTLAGLQADIARLDEKGSQQARAQQAELAGWRQRLRDGEAALRRHEDTLVGPERMVELLEQLLARHGAVRVRALRSLGRSDLLAAGGTAPANTAPANTAPANATAAAPGLYRHGVELVLEGGFADLLSYLRAMEALPQRLLWGGVSLKVEQHPRSLLTLRVYTISRERHWLEI